MKNTWQKHKTFWTQKAFIINTLVGLALLVVSLFGNIYANTYTSKSASNPVTDILLDNLPVVNVDFVFSEGPIIFFLVIAIILFFEPKYIPFVLKSAALFVIVRSLFMVLTHLAPPPNASYIYSGAIAHRLSSGDDLFFSGHTGMPFLLAFVFKDIRAIKYFFLACTLIGGVSVILGHLHYSIDVFSALFIAFGIYCLAKYFFARDFHHIAN